MDKQQIGITGEHLVASQLCKLGFVVALTRKNTRSVDVLCINPKTLNCYALQVKSTTTRLTRRCSWVLHKNNGSINSPNFFYVFVNFNSGVEDRFFIVPSSFVSKTITERHKKWVVNHNDNNVRSIFFEDIVSYEDRWDLLS